MAKMTLLEMVQDILGAMNSDDVNSISDTQEAYDVARIVQMVYEELMVDKDWPHLATLVQLTATSTTTPTHMLIPDNIQRLEWIKYNKRKSTDTRDKYSDVTYLLPYDFVQLVMARDSSADNVETITDPGGPVLLVRNDIAPTYWTSFDDEYIVFDSYDSAVDDNLRSSKTQCRVYKEATFTLSNTFVPDLPSKSFPQLLAEAKSTAFAQIKQVLNEKEELRARRQRQRQSRENWRLSGGIQYPDYGRK